MAKVSVPRMVRHELLLDPTFCVLEFHMIEQIFLPNQRTMNETHPTNALHNFHILAVLVIDAFASEFHEKRDFPAIDVDEVFFAVTDKYRVGLAMGRESYSLVRGIQEFVDIVLDQIFWVKQNGENYIVTASVPRERGVYARGDDDDIQFGGRNATRRNEVTAELFNIHAVGPQQQGQQQTGPSNGYAGQQQAGVANDCPVQQRAGPSNGHAVQQQTGLSHGYGPQQHAGSSNGYTVQRQPGPFNSYPVYQQTGPFNPHADPRQFGPFNGYPVQQQSGSSHDFHVQQHPSPSNGYTTQQQFGPRNGYAMPQQSGHPNNHTYAAPAGVGLLNPRPVHQPQQQQQQQPPSAFAAPATPSSTRRKNPITRSTQSIQATPPRYLGMPAAIDDPAVPKRKPRCDKGILRGPRKTRPADTDTDADAGSWSNEAYQADSSEGNAGVGTGVKGSARKRGRGKDGV
ncbi:hypothetical protein B0J11DRAFT_151473 [Dendryphion nanum]|uniref:Uncharacterized protein n=1 Tax=Dendryphion nanum TaxID=256645 RepID=A0A9P9ITR1_9PLEO|nr:hypothetical protein B0J11DRAFT_151473 [Dendryphion nanum]